jgi:phospholipid/cholesterol/gamma-HCH transport system substrate-binding protein
MSRFTTSLKVGVLTVATVLVALLVLRFVDRQVSSDDGYLVYVLLEDVGGIAKRSLVRVAGIPVGSVEDIRLQGEQARVDIRVQPDVPLYEDAVAGKNMRNLLGESFIGLSPGTPGRRQLKDGDEVHSAPPSATPDQLLQNMSRIAQTVERITTAIEASVGSEASQQNMRDTLENLAEVTRALNLTVNENRESIRNILSGVEAVTTQGQGDAVEILDNMRVVTGEFRRLMAGNEGGTGTTDQVRGLVDRVDRSTQSLEKVLANMETVTGRLERGEGTLGRLSKDEKLINEIENVTQQVNNYVTGLSQLRTIVALRTDYQFRAQTVKSYVELRLQPREDKFYSIEIVNDPRGLTKIEQVNVNTTNPNDPNQYQEIRSVTSNALRFSLQFAQRFGPFIGRFGLKESTGGVGLDLLLLDDAFELRQDLFGFGEVIRPRWRLSLGYAFLNRLWLMGGVDDIMSGDRREYFLGAQLRFDDEDLKTVLPFAPAVDPGR